MCKLVKRICLIVIFATFWSAFSLQAGTITDIVTVGGTTMPWLWNTSSLNPTFQFGIQDGTDPIVVDSTSAISFAPGGTLTLSFLDGTTSADIYAGSPFVDANGYTPASPSIYFANNNPGTSGEYFPSLYMGPANYPIYLNALVATFTDSLGDIVGTPFAVGGGPVSVLVPVGATQLQLGINDDIFYDNAGSLSVSVEGPDPPSAPEPVSFLLIAFPLAALTAFEYRKRHCR